MIQILSIALGAAATLISGMILFNLRAMDKRIAAVESDLKEAAKRKDRCRQDFVDKVDYIRSYTTTEKRQIKMLEALSEIKGSMAVFDKMPQICGNIASQIVKEMKKEIKSNG
ncbi:MAG: hypothetical protein FVQ82_12900 [Planctomycetes bacterium]|nr:hypothetical protein [Planctomycetota bacterium]